MRAARAAARASPEWYRSRGFGAIPSRGPLAANTVAGTVSGWEAALEVGRRWGGTCALDQILADAIHYAEHGTPVTASQHANTRTKRAELDDVPGFGEQFVPGGAVPAVGDRFVNMRLGSTLRRLARDGLDSFYRGALAGSIAADLERIGSPLAAGDLERHHARVTKPLRLSLRPGTAYNFPPPTQGLASLMILGIFERLGIAEADGFAYLHGLVEASKQAFLVRDREITDPAYMGDPPERFLAPAALDAAAAAVDPERALEWPQPPAAGDTIWMGAVDGDGPRGQLHPERVLGVRLGRGAGGDRHPVAEPRIQLQPRGRRAQRPRARPQAVPHPEPGPVPVRRRPHDALRHHGRAKVSPRPRRRC